MGFKLKSQKAVKQGGFKAMGSSPMKEDDVTAKIDELDNQELYEKGATKYSGQGIGTDLGAMQFLPEVDVERKKVSPIADAINKATEVKPKKLNIDYKPKSKKSSTSSGSDVKVKTRFINDVKDVEKRTYTTDGGIKVKEKKKFSPSGEVVKTKKKARKGDTIIKTKTKGDKTKRKIRKAGSLLNETTKRRISEVKGKAKEKIDKLKSKLKK
jgi:hypothetical protein